MNLWQNAIDSHLFGGWLQRAKSLMLLMSPRALTSNSSVNKSFLCVCRASSLSFRIKEGEMETANQIEQRSTHMHTHRHTHRMWTRFSFVFILPFLVLSSCSSQSEICLFLQLFCSVVPLLWTRLMRIEFARFGDFLVPSIQIQTSAGNNSPNLSRNTVSSSRDFKLFPILPYIFLVTTLVLI